MADSPSPYQEGGNLNLDPHVHALDILVSDGENSSAWRGDIRVTYGDQKKYVHTGHFPLWGFFAGFRTRRIARKVVRKHQRGTAKTASRLGPRLALAQEVKVQTDAEVAQFVGAKVCECGHLMVGRHNTASAWDLLAYLCELCPGGRCTAKANRKPNKKDMFRKAYSYVQEAVPVGR